MVNAEEWETHKDKLSDLTRAVYDAIQKTTEADRIGQIVKRAEECNVRPLFNEVRDMFRKGFNYPNERARFRPMGVEIHLPGKSSTRSDARVDVTNQNGGQVDIIFYGA